MKEVKLGKMKEMKMVEMKVKVVRSGDEEREREKRERCSARGYTAGGKAPCRGRPVEYVRSEQK